MDKVLQTAFHGSTPNIELVVDLSNFLLKVAEVSAIRKLNLMVPRFHYSALSECIGEGLHKVDYAFEFLHPRADLARLQHRGLPGIPVIAELHSRQVAVTERLHALQSLVLFVALPQKPVIRLLNLRVFEVLARYSLLLVDSLEHHLNCLAALSPPNNFHHDVIL